MMNGDDDDDDTTCFHNFKLNMLSVFGYHMTHRVTDYHLTYYL